MAASANSAHREGLNNALFVVASVAAMPVELDGVAAQVSVLFPWGSLLEGVSRPEPRALAALGRVARDRASLDVVINRSALRFGVDGLAERYRRVGIAVDRLDWISASPYRTTWGKRVTFRSDALHIAARLGESSSTESEPAR